MRTNLIRAEALRFTSASLASKHKGETFVGRTETGETTMFYVSRSGVIALDDTNYAKGAFWEMSNLTVFVVKRFCDAVVTEA